MITDPRNREEQPDETCTPGHFFQEIEIEFLIHELKGPLSIVETGIRCLLEKKDKYGALSLRQEKILKRTAKNIKNARGMVNGLLEIGRSEAGVCVCCRFQPSRAANEVLIEALEITSGVLFEASGNFPAESEWHQFLSTNGIFMDVSPQANDIEMVQDETKFRQILGNLVSNALYHRKNRVEIRMREESDHLLLEVTDDGPGIEPEHHDVIFKQYAQIKRPPSIAPRKGHGLGLAGALILARCLGGDIQIQSKKGKGASFCLTLPIKLQNGPLPLRSKVQSRD